MPNQFNSASEGDLEQYFATDYWLMDQYVGDQLWMWGENDNGILGDGDRAGNINRSTPITTFTGGTNWKQISIGNVFTAAIKTDGTLWTWGTGNNGRLGNAATTATVSTPVTTFAGGADWKLVSAGRDICSAIKTDGTLWTWGYSASGRLGNASTSAVNVSTPITTFAGGSNWKTVSSSIGTVAIKTDGTLWIWGTLPELASGNSDGYVQFYSTPITTFVGGTNWKKAVIGSANSVIALKTDGTLWTWGNGLYGMLGRDVQIFNSVSTPITTFSGGNNWADTATTNPEDLYTISASANFSTAIKTDGTLWTWGNASDRMIGDGRTTTCTTPVTTFTGGTNWSKVYAAPRHVAAIKTDGTLWTWGANNFGMLGNAGAVTFFSTPSTTFAGGTNWSTVSASSSSTSAIKTDGTLWIWGNASVIVPFDSTTSISTPITSFAGGTDWKTVSSGNQCVAAIKTDGTLWTWGTENNILLARTTTILTPITTFAGGTNWYHTGVLADDMLSLCVGGESSMAIKTDGTLWVWGNNNDGFNSSSRLGNTEISGSVTTPITTFAGGTNWKQVSTSINGTSCGVKTDGTLWVWGNGANGRLGIGGTIGKSTPVTTFAGGTNWKQVSASGAVAAIKTDGTLWTWGSNASGVLGIAIAAGGVRSTPVTTFAGGTNWKQVSISSGNSCAAIKTDGTLWTWGNTSSGQLGNGATATIRSTPVTTFSGGTNWSQVSSAGLHVAAVKTDGTLWTWGSNTNFGLGNASILTVSIPVTTFAGGTDWSAVSAGYSTAALKTDGTLWVWGLGGSGRLGTNDTTDRSTPVTTFIGGTNWKSVNVGGGNMMAVSFDGVNRRLYVAGSNSSLGLGVPPQGVIPTKIDNALTWKQVHVGAQSAVAIKTDGTLWGWGNNSSGQLGNGATTNRSTPVTTFAGGTDWKQANISNLHTAAIKTDGTLWTWGENDNGRLGDADNVGNINKSTPVTTFAGGTNWKQASAGDSHTLALSDDGVNKRLYAFGFNSPPGLGSYIIPSGITPNTTFAGGTNWKEICPGHSTFGGIKKDGTLWVWGNRVSAAANLLGNGGTSSASISTPVTTFIGGNNWKNARFTSATAIAIKTDGTLWTWGNTGAGQLGNASTSTTAHVSTPITTFAGGNDWKQIAAESGTQATLGAVKYGTQADLPL